MVLTGFCFGKAFNQNSDDLIIMHRMLKHIKDIPLCCQASLEMEGQR